MNLQLVLNEPFTSGLQAKLSGEIGLQGQDGKILDRPPPPSACLHIADPTPSPPLVSHFLTKPVGNQFPTTTVILALWSDNTVSSY